VVFSHSCQAGSEGEPAISVIGVGGFQPPRHVRQASAISREAMACVELVMNLRNVTEDWREGKIYYALRVENEAWLKVGEEVE